MRGGGLGSGGAILRDRKYNRGEIGGAVKSSDLRMEVCSLI